MEYPRQIVIHPNPNFKEPQIQKLCNSLQEHNWLPFDWNGYVHYKGGNNLDIQSLPADNIGIEKQNDAIDFAQKTNSSISLQFYNDRLKKGMTLIYSENQYTFYLESSNEENDLEEFDKYHSSIYSALFENFYLNKIEWRKGSQNSVFRCFTDMYHEGVMILASSNKLKQYYSEREFDYDFPEGIRDLIAANYIIAVNSSDFEYSTIIELEQISNLKFGYFNTLEFESKDELLVLHHGDFTMICDKHKGDYKSYGWKHIISIPIEKQTSQEILIGKLETEETTKLVFQFSNIERKARKNLMVEIEGIPTHNKWS
jgi:hypothetical protein